MKQTSMIRSIPRKLIFTAILIALASAGWSLFNGFGGRDTVSAQIPVTVVSAASFAGDKVLAPDAIAAAFGSFVTQNNQSFTATSQPLPTTLGGVRVTIGAIDAGLLFVGPLQINFLMPSGLADTQSATITVTNSDNTTRTGTFSIVRSAPGVFSARADGSGVAAALTTFDGIAFQPVFDVPGLTERDVDAGTQMRPNILVLFTTGIRNTPAANPSDANGVAEAVTVRFQGVPSPLQFAGPAPGFAGLDQINVPIPPELSGIGSIRVEVSANGRTSNPVTIRLGGQTPPVRVTPIAFGATTNGELTIADQVQAGNAMDTFFFDAYSFSTTAANTPVTIDLRSTQFDAAVLLYRVDNNTLTFIAADDQSGGYGNGVIANTDALLLTVIVTPGNYVVFASSSDEEPNGVGAYSLSLRNDVITQISYGQTTTGASITNTDFQTSAGTYLDIYWFSGVQGDRQQIRMNSTVFDSFLILQGNEGDPPLTADDNSGGGPQNRDSLIDPTNGDVDGFPPIANLPRTGPYIIIATPFETNRTGAYTLSLNKLANFGAETESQLKTTPPGRQIRDSRGRVASFGRTSFERFGIRRIIER